MKTILRFFFVCAATYSPIPAGAQNGQPMIGESAPAFSLPSTDDKVYSLKDYNGKIVVIHFAATWCPFCNAEAPYLEQLFKDYKDKGVQVFIIDVKEDKALVNKSFQKFNFSFPVLLDSSGRVSAMYAPKDVLPDLAREEVPLASNLIIDKEGKVRFYSLLNTTNFDAKLVHVKEKLDELLHLAEKP